MRPFLDLGLSPVANTLVRDAQQSRELPQFPLVVGFCESCALVQLTQTSPDIELFDAEYPYFSSFSDELLRHSKEHVDLLLAEHSLDERSLVVEVASNDGYLLRGFAGTGVRVVGVEPTPEPAAAARAIGIPTVEAFFGVQTAEQLVAEHGNADVVIAKNVMAHVPELNDFVAGLAVLVSDTGTVEIENPGVRYLVDSTEFDTVYHEHFCYFSTIAVQALLLRHGLHLNDVVVFPDLHGGTLRWVGSRTPGLTERAARVLQEEREAGLDSFAYYADFSARVQALATDLRRMLEEARAQGARVAAYGAAAKGVTLLSFCGIGDDMIEFVVDRNPHKIGKFMPGTGIPILPVEALSERHPDVALVLAWNFATEIVAQQAEFRQQGGRFLVPIPAPRYVGGEAHVPAPSSSTRLFSGDSARVHAVIASLVVLGSRSTEVVRWAPHLRAALRG